MADGWVCYIAGMLTALAMLNGLYGLWGWTAIWSVCAVAALWIGRKALG